MGCPPGLRAEGEEVRSPELRAGPTSEPVAARVSIESARLLWGTVQTAAVVAALVIDWATGRVAVLSVLMGVLMVTALLEFYGMAGLAQGYRLWGAVAVGALAAGPLVTHGVLEAELEWSGVMLAVFVLGLFLVDWVAGGVGNQLTRAAVTAFGVVYVWGLLSFVTRLAELPTAGIAGVALLFAVAKGSDISAYYVGSRWGRHRVAPRVSPNKSVEGVVGAVAVSLVLAALLVPFFKLPFSWAGALLFGAVVSVASQLGDLGESLLKRKLKTKDSARLLPGFGGVLDMVDSLTGAAPVAYVFFRFLA